MSCRAVVEKAAPVLPIPASQGRHQVSPDKSQRPSSALAERDMRLSIEQTGAIVPPPSLMLNERAEVWRDVRGQVSAYAEVRGEDYWIHLPGLASFRFSTRGDE